MTTPASAMSDEGAPRTKRWFSRFATTSDVDWGDCGGGCGGSGAFGGAGGGRGGRGASGG